MITRIARPRLYGAGFGFPSGFQQMKKTMTANHKMEQKPPKTYLKSFRQYLGFRDGKTFRPFSDRRVLAAAWLKPCFGATRRRCKSVVMSATCSSTFSKSFATSPLPRTFLGFVDDFTCSSPVKGCALDMLNESVLNSMGIVELFA